MITERIKPIYIFLFLAGVLFVITYGILNYTYNLNNPLIISKVPSDITLYIDDKKVDGSRTKLSSGIHLIKAEKDGFTSMETQQLIDDDTKYIPVALLPSSDEAKKWASDNQQLYLDQEALVGPSEEAATTQTDTSLVPKLPLSGTGYSIGYVLDPSDTSGKSVIITVHADPGYDNVAIRAIYDAGFDPASYTYLFSSGAGTIESAENADE